MQICGIDDAGRGSMLGPLVIAGILLDKKNIRKLSKLGVKDSKKLSPKLLNADVKSKIEIFVQQDYINARKKIYITVKLKKNIILVFSFKLL